MARQQLRNQTIGPNGVILSDAVVDEPQDQWYAREIADRLQTFIATATAGIAAADVDLAEIDAIVWANFTTAAQVRTKLIECVARQRRIVNRQRITVVMVRNMLRQILRRFDALDAE